MTSITPMVKESTIEIAYKWTTGKALGRFFTELRDHQKIMAIKCPSCGRVYVPPQEFCESCFVDMNDWVELDGTGTLESFTIIRRQTPNQPVAPPYAVGLIHFTGADTDLIHLIGGVDMDRIHCGMTVKPRWKDEPAGNILDIVFFEPV